MKAELQTTSNLFGVQSLLAEADCQPASNSNGTFESCLPCVNILRMPAALTSASHAPSLPAPWTSRLLPPLTFFCCQKHQILDARCVSFFLPCLHRRAVSHRAVHVAVWLNRPLYRQMLPSLDLTSWPLGHLPRARHVSGLSSGTSTF